MTAPVTGITPVYGLEYLVEGEPVRNTRQKLERNAKGIEAALVARGVPPTDLAALIAAGWFTDSGWVTVPPASGFTASGTPAVRKRANVLYFRGGWTNAGMAASGVYTVGTLPAGFRPDTQVNTLASSSNGSTVARLLLNTNGTIQVVTGSTLGAYYRMDGIAVVLP